MKQFKSDGRYNYYKQGLHYIVEFRWNNRDDSQLYIKLITYFKEVYGPDKEQVYVVDNVITGLGRWIANENWRCEQRWKTKQRRIYLRDESALTLALLKIEP